MLILAVFLYFIIKIKCPKVFCVKRMSWLYVVTKFDPLLFVAVVARRMPWSRGKLTVQFSSKNYR